VIENLTEMVLKLSEEVGQLRRDNEYLKIKMESIYTESRPRLSCVQNSLPRRDVMSSAALKDNVPKTYKDALSAGSGPMAAPVSAAIVPPKTAINEMHSEPTVDLDIPLLPLCCLSLLMTALSQLLYAIQI
jgi:hypothetical protein